MKIVFRIFSIGVCSLLAIILTHIFNICDFIKCVPSEHKYDVCLMVYFSIFESIRTSMHKKISEWWDQKKTVVEAVFFLPSQVKNLQAKPIAKFNELDMAHIKLGLKISGKRSNLKNNGVRINLPGLVDAQFERNDLGTNWDSYGQLWISFEDVIRNTDNLMCEYDYKIVFTRNEYDNSATISISPTLLKKNPNIKFLYNTAELFMEEKAQ